MGVIDILYLAKGRHEFTRASLGELDDNTTWGLVDRFVAYTDGEIVANYLGLGMDPLSVAINTEALGGPVAITNHFIARPGAEFFAKIDNDVIVPPGWLDSALDVMKANPKLDILGLEPPFSRNVKMDNDRPGGVSAAYGEPESAARCGLCASDRITMLGYAPDYCDDCGAWDAPGGWLPSGKSYMPEMYKSGKFYRGYAKVRAVGGVFVARRAAFENRVPPKPHGFNGVGGFTGWQLEHSGARAAAEQRELEVGWIVPPLKLFLLDRLPFEPWASLSKRYIAEGSQRPWAMYNGCDMEAYHLYGWWDRSGYPGERQACMLETALDPR